MLKKVVCSAVLFSIICLSACTSNNSETANINTTRAMNLSNMGCIAEDIDHTVYQIEYSGSTEIGILKKPVNGGEEYIYYGATCMLYAADNGILYYISDDDTLCGYTMSNGETTMVTDLNVRSYAVINDKVYLLAREDPEAKFEIYEGDTVDYVFEKIELTADDITLRYLYPSDNKLYIVGSNGAYYLDADGHLVLVAEFPEPLQKLLTVNDILYAVGNDSIFKLTAEGEIESIAPRYIGMATTINVLSDSIIYSGHGGLYSYNTNTGKTKQISHNLYQEIYVVQGKIIGETYGEEGIKFENIT
ncbi:MAG: hypothetical protein LUG13_09505 [Oscillospiraceae bacterium]|nr:hypothetical protein [Oscillospiraceae bacterium]